MNAPTAITPPYKHTPLFPLGKDSAPYRKLIADGVRVEKIMGKDVLVIEREAMRALAEAAFWSDVLVAAGERNRLKADESDFLGVFHREFHDGADLIVVHVIDDGHHQHDFDAGFVHVLDGAQLHVE